MRIFLFAFALFAIFIPAVAGDSSAQTESSSLDAAIKNLSEDMRSEKDFTVVIDGRFLGKLSDQLAKASTRDLQIKVLPGRIHSSESDLGFAKYQNYLDIDGGKGYADLREASVEEIRNGKIRMLIDMAGRVTAKAHGKQIGFEYNATPEIGMKMRDRVTLVLEPAGSDFQLRPTAKQLTAHLDISVSAAALGTKINTTQDVAVDASRLLQPIKLPRVVSPNLQLPGRNRAVALSNLGYKADEGRMRLDADLSFH